MNPIEQLARDLLARLSYDYGDSEDCPAEVQALFDRGEQLLPIGGPDDIVARTRLTPPMPEDDPVYTREECTFNYCDNPGLCKQISACRYVGH